MELSKPYKYLLGTKNETLVTTFESQDEKGVELVVSKTVAYRLGGAKTSCRCWFYAIKKHLCSDCSDIL